MWSGGHGDRAEGHEIGNVTSKAPQESTKKHICFEVIVRNRLGYHRSISSDAICLLQQFMIGLGKAQSSQRDYAR